MIINYAVSFISITYLHKSIQKNTAISRNHPGTSEHEQTMNFLVMGDWSYCSPRIEFTTPDSEHLDTARGLVFQGQTTYLLPTISLGAKILVS